MNFKLADRVKNLPTYLFAELDRLKSEALKRGVDVIDLGVGDPLDPTPPHIVQAMHEATRKVENHRYPSYVGMRSFREAVAKYYVARDVTLNPDNEVIALIGSKEGIAHIHFAFVNPGDVVLVPSPGYPVFSSSTLFSGGRIVTMPLLEKNGFLPDFSKIKEEDARAAKIMFLNYPNNPTGAVASIEFYKEAIAFAKKYNIILFHDAAYSEVYYDKRPVSFLELEGAREVGIEFGSLSKTYNMTGWRIGWAAGNADVIFGLGKIKTNMDSGAFSAVQEAGIVALTQSQDCVEEMRHSYRIKKDVVVKGLSEAGLHVYSPGAAFYIWFKKPENFYNSKAFSKYVLDKAGVVITPGNGFGEYGEGYMRISLTAPLPRLKEALERLKSVLTI